MPKSKKKSLLFYEMYRAGISAGGAPSIYVSDSFTGNDNDVLSAHTPDIDVEGVGWHHNVGSDLQIQSNELQYMGAAFSNALAGIDIGVSDNYEVKLTIRTLPGGTDETIGLLARIDEIEGGFVALWFRLRTSGIWFLSAQNGAGLLDNGAGLTIATGDTMAMRVQGTTITVFHNDIEIGSGTSSDWLTSTEVGIAYQDENNSDGTMDDFIVTPL